MMLFCHSEEPVLSKDEGSYSADESQYTSIKFLS